MSSDWKDNDDWDWTEDEDWTSQEGEVFSKEEWMIDCYSECEEIEAEDSTADSEIDLVFNIEEQLCGGYVILIQDMVSQAVLESFGPYSSEEEAFEVREQLYEDGSSGSAYTCEGD